MADRKRFKCLNCGERFESVVLTPEEAWRMRREGKNTSPLHCPRCHRTDVTIDR